MRTTAESPWLLSTGWTPYGRSSLSIQTTTSQTNASGDHHDDDDRRGDDRDDDATSGLVAVTLMWMLDPVPDEEGGLWWPR